jgi:hypothetical protein
MHVISPLKAEKRCKFFVEVVYVRSKKSLECEEMFTSFPTDLSAALAKEFIFGKVTR